MTDDRWQSVSAAFLRTQSMFELWEQHKSDVWLRYLSPSGTIDDSILIDRASGYLILAVASLFAVLEYLKDAFVGLPQSIQDDVVNIYPKLREFRNCVFHVQNRVLDKRQFSLFDFPNSLPVIIRIYREIEILLISLAPKGDKRE